MLYYYLNEKRHPVGPLDADALQALYKSGAIRAQTLVIVKGAKDWRPYADLFAVKPTPAPAPEPPQADEDDEDGEDGEDEPAFHETAHASRPEPARDFPRELPPKNAVVAAPTTERAESANGQRILVFVLLLLVLLFGGTWSVASYLASRQETPQPEPQPQSPPRPAVETATRSVPQAPAPPPPNAIGSQTIAPLRPYLSRYERSGTRYERKCPAEFESLYELVKDKIGRDDLAEIINRVPSDLDPATYQKLYEFAGPRSIAQQRQTHKDYIPILVNERTIQRGLRFFADKREVLLRAYRETGVKPEDIMALLNWESKFGDYLGTFSVYRIFVGEFCYFSEMEQKQLQSGAYDAPDVMPREKALARIERIKKGAIANMAALIAMALQKHYNLYDIKGSWGGAIGIPQFMPASMGYAADGNGDHEIDLNNMDDAIFSIANYLKENGYASRGARYAFRKYNNEEMYIKGVGLYSEGILKAGLRY